MIGTGGISGTIGLQANGTLHRKFGKFEAELKLFSLTFRQGMRKSATGRQPRASLKRHNIRGLQRLSYKSLVLLLSISLVITFCDFSKIKASPSDKKEINTLQIEKYLTQNASRKIDTIHRKEKFSNKIIVKKNYKFTSIKNECYINITYPHVKFTKKTKTENQINTIILKAFELSNYKKIQNEKECADEEISKNFDFVIYKNILSISIFNNFLGKGAGHGYIETTALNIDLVKGKRILAEELFKVSVLEKLKEKLLMQAKLKTDSLIGSFPMDIIIQGINQLNYTISDKGFTFYTLTGNGQVQEISVFVPLKEIIYYLKPNLILVKDYLVAHNDYKLTSYYLNITCCPKIETRHT